MIDRRFAGAFIAVWVMGLGVTACSHSGSSAAGGSSGAGGAGAVAKGTGTSGAGTSGASAGGGGASGAAASGAGAGAAGRASGGGAGGTAAGGQGGSGSAQPCVELKLAAGETSPDGILALHVPANALVSYGAGPIIRDGQVYFGLSRAVMRVPIGGGSAEMVRALPFDGALFFLVGTDILWVETDTTMTPSVSRILRAPLASSSAAPSVVADKIAEPEYVVADSTAVYFSNRTDQNWYKAPLDGSPVTVLAKQAQPLGALVVGSDLYWLDFGTNQLTSVPTAGGQPVQHVEVFFGGPMAADGSTIYWNDTSRGTIERWSPGEKQSTVLARFDFSTKPGAIAVADGSLYYGPTSIGCDGVHVIPKDGSASHVVAQGFSGGGGLVFDGAYGYIAADNGLFRFAK